jgi:hypothetical protein
MEVKLNLHPENLPESSLVQTIFTIPYSMYCEGGNLNPVYADKRFEHEDGDTLEQL